MVTLAGLRVPSAIDEVTTRWLSEALRADGTMPESLAVKTIRVEQIAQDTGFSSLLYRLHLTGDAGVPPTVIVKLPAQSEARWAMDMLGGYRRELSFYQYVAGRAPIATPHLYAAGMTDESADFVLVLEDLRDWDNADHLAGLSMHRARLCIEQLAGMHAWSVTTPDARGLDAFPSLDTPTAGQILHPAFELGWRVYCDKSTVAVPAAVARYAEGFVQHAPKALAGLTERPMLLHGDIRADNMFFDGDLLKIVDFQFAPKGSARSTSVTWLARDCRRRCAADTTSSWCASTSFGSLTTVSSIIRSTRRGATIGLRSPISCSSPSSPSSAGTLCRNAHAHCA